MATWAGGNRYLSQSEMDNNAQIIYDNLPWTINAVCAALGNMVRESTINPNIWEGLQPTTDYDAKHGYGLVQWTPVRKLITYCDSIGESWTSGYAQLKMITNDMQTSVQWFANNYANNYGLPINPPITSAEYIRSNLDVETLTKYWCMYYEHPAQSEYAKTIASRISYAKYYLTAFGGTTPNPDPDPVPPDPDPVPPDPTQPTIIITPSHGVARAGETFRFSATVRNSEDTDIAWMIISGKQYATMTNEGRVTLKANSKGQVILVKCWLARNPSVYSVAELRVEGGGKWIYYMRNWNNERR